MPDTYEARAHWGKLLADHVSDESWQRAEYLNFQAAKADQITRELLERIFQNKAEWQVPLVLHPEGTA